MLWIRSETPPSLIASVTEIAKHLSFQGLEPPGRDHGQLTKLDKWLKKNTGLLLPKAAREVTCISYSGLRLTIGQHHSYRRCGS